MKSGQWENLEAHFLLLSRCWRERRRSVECDVENSPQSFLCLPHNPNQPTNQVGFSWTKTIINNPRLWGDRDSLNHPRTIKVELMWAKSSRRGSYESYKILNLELKAKRWLGDWELSSQCLICHGDKSKTSTLVSVEQKPTIDKGASLHIFLIMFLNLQPPRAMSVNM